MRTMHEKGISQKLGVKLLRIILHSGDDECVIKQLMQIVQESETEEEILAKVKAL
jgi:hypothetical protein